MESGSIEISDDIEIQCFYTIDNNEFPVKKQKYKLILSDETEIEDESDDKGIIKSVDVIPGMCTLLFNFNDEENTYSSFLENKDLVFETGKTHKLSLPVLALHLEINPDDPASNDDKYTLFSQDDKKYYKKILTNKDDKVGGDKCIDLHFPGIKKNLKYTMEIDPGAEGEKYYLFKDMIL